MLSIKDMFYPSDLETVWIVKPEKKDDKKDKDVKPEPAPPPTPQEIAFGPFYPFPFPEYKPVPAKKPDPSAKKLIHMKASICCETCNEVLRIALEGLKGVKPGSVLCDIAKEKVTVEVTTATSDDVLLKCRESFEDAKLWG